MPSEEEEREQGGGGRGPEAAAPRPHLCCSATRPSSGPFLSSAHSAPYDSSSSSPWATSRVAATSITHSPSGPVGGRRSQRTLSQACTSRCAAPGGEVMRSPACAGRGRRECFWRWDQSASRRCQLTQQHTSRARRPAGRTSWPGPSAPAPSPLTTPSRRAGAPHVVQHVHKGHQHAHAHAAAAPRCAKRARVHHRQRPVPARRRVARAARLLRRGGRQPRGVLQLAQHGRVLRRAQGTRAVQCMAGDGGAYYACPGGREKTGTLLLQSRAPPLPPPQTRQPTSTACTSSQEKAASGAGTRAGSTAR